MSSTRAFPRATRRGSSYGAIGWYVPLERFPDTYNNAAARAGRDRQPQAVCHPLPELGLRQPGDRGWFKQRWAEAGKKLNMGKSCVYLKKLDDVPLEVVGDLIAKVPLRRVHRLLRGGQRIIAPDEGRAVGHSTICLPSASSPSL